MSMYRRVKILQPVIDAAVKARAVPVWPTYDNSLLDRSKYVSSSEIGKCARQVWFSKNVPLSEGNAFYWGFAERGHSHEAWIVEQLKAYEHDYRWSYIGKEQVSFHADYQSGTPDGLLEATGMVLVVDFKSIDPRKSLSKLPAAEHLDQLIQNMDLVEHCLDLSVDGALLAYSDASDYSKIHEWLIERDSPQVGERMVELETRAHTIMQATSAEQLPAEGVYAGTCTNCPFKAECSGAVMQQQQERVNYERAKRTSASVFGQHQAASPRASGA